MVQGIGLQQAAIDVLNAKQVAHMETYLFLVFLLVGAIFIGPLGNVFHLSDPHIVLVQDGQQVLVLEPLGQGVGVGFGPQAKPFVASGFGGADPFLKAAFVSQSPGADGNRTGFRHGKFLLCTVLQAAGFAFYF